MPSPNTLPDDITIEYSSRGKRTRKHFTNRFEARRFWGQKDAAGKSPKVVRPILAPVYSLQELHRLVQSNPRYMRLLLHAGELNCWRIDKARDFTAALLEQESGEWAAEVLEKVNAAREAEAEGGALCR
jgi:hypothetical protein